MGQITVEKNVGGIEGLCVITPAVHGDSRGYFMETYNQRDMEEAGLDIIFVQDNQSMSTKGVLRGLHFQKHYPQTKLVRVIKGAVFDVAVDLRFNSETYGKWYGLELTEENKKQFLIPTRRNLLINARISTIREMKAAWPGTIRRSVLNGRELLGHIRDQLVLKVIA